MSRNPEDKNPLDTLFDHNLLNNIPKLLFTEFVTILFREHAIPFLTSADHLLALVPPNELPLMFQNIFEDMSNEELSQYFDFELVLCHTYRDTIILLLQVFFKDLLEQYAALTKIHKELIQLTDSNKNLVKDYLKGNRNSLPASLHAHEPALLEISNRFRNKFGIKIPVEYFDGFCGPLIQNHLILPPISLLEKKNLVYLPTHLDEYLNQSNHYIKPTDKSPLMVPVGVNENLEIINGNKLLAKILLFMGSVMFSITLPLLIMNKGHRTLELVFMTNAVLGLVISFFLYFYSNYFTPETQNLISLIETKNKSITNKVNEKSLCEKLTGVLDTAKVRFYRRKEVAGNNASEPLIELSQRNGSMYV